MILNTLERVPGREVTEILGPVRGSTVRARDLGKDIKAIFKGMVGGEVHEYTKLLAEAREQALDRVAAEARGLGADAVLGLRFATSEIAKNMAEILVYGTAVKLSAPADDQ